MFEPTYEELKFHCCYSKYWNTVSFEPTYEELKYWEYNWFKSWNLVWAYLWGIESVNEDSANPPEEGFRPIYEGFENLNCQGIWKKHIESLARNLKKEFLIKEIIKKIFENNKIIFLSLIHCAF